MNAMLGFAQLLELDTDPARQRAQVGEIRQGGLQLLALINGLLDLARIEPDRLAVLRRAVPVQALLADCVGQLAAPAQRRGIHLDLQTGDAGLAATANPTRLRQVLLNLLGNAIKFNHDGGRVRLSARREGDQVRLTVADGGPGIAATQQPLLFQRFERLPAKGALVEGAGIGLALSRHLVQLMHGENGVQCEAGRGSGFWITLEAAVAALPAKPYRVLYIEDNPINTLLMAAMLDRLPDVELICAHVAEEGLALAIHEPPALVLADIQMPGMDNYGLLRSLQAEPRKRHIPVIAVSANAMPQDLARGLAAVSAALAAGASRP